MLDSQEGQKVSALACLRAPSWPGLTQSLEHSETRESQKGFGSKGFSRRRVVESVKCEGWDIAIEVAQLWREKADWMSLLLLTGQTGLSLFLGEELNSFCFLGTLRDQVF